MKIHIILLLPFHFYLLPTYFHQKFHSIIQHAVSQEHSSPESTVNNFFLFNIPSYGHQSLILILNDVWSRFESQTGISYVWIQNQLRTTTTTMEPHLSFKNVHCRLHPNFYLGQEAWNGLQDNIQSTRRARYVCRIGSLNQVENGWVQYISMVKTPLAPVANTNAKFSIQSFKIEIFHDVLENSLI